MLLNVLCHTEVNISEYITALIRHN